ncbi:Gfo/Idh/MocA family protein [Aquicella lusitana]|uniref:Putative dehydrogenase n=1 Tax=Aquicella lusitana TaxID=254246 RepID=A0A370GIN3_9COXI|nr:Gfo/Idh/MocA family oxidoreductase [Aquicella lusitana]RDI41793.1 putative dehydrogenase [Aquicella lusitana]VVC73702.1 1,5-anhydro-D-fructose reductase [Aquicella lusitana]
MSADCVRWGILGTSYISEVMAKAIQTSPASQLTAVGSRSFQTAKQFSDKFSIPKFYDTYQSLLNDADVDAVYIGLPNHLHKEWIVRCALAGKHILCEKPFVLTATEAQEVISIVNKSRVFCMEALMYRCHPVTKKLKELVKNNIIGDIKLYHAVYTANIASIANSTAGGSIRNLGCYPISLIRLLADAEPIEINAMGRINAATQLDNQASVMLKFENNTIAIVSTADDMEMYWQFDIYGTEGHLKVMTNPWLPESHNKIMVSRKDEDKPREINVIAEKSLYTYQIDIASKSILSGNFVGPEGISLLDSLGNITVLEAWLKQVKAQAILSAKAVLTP